MKKERFLSGLLVVIVAIIFGIGACCPEKFTGTYQAKETDHWIRVVLQHDLQTGHLSGSVKLAIFRWGLVVPVEGNVTCNVFSFHSCETGELPAVYAHGMGIDSNNDGIVDEITMDLELCSSPTEKAGECPKESLAFGRKPS